MVLLIQKNFRLSPEQEKIAVKLYHCQAIELLCSGASQNFQLLFLTEISRTEDEFMKVN